jgi:hypothetical protein
VAHRGLPKAKLGLSGNVCSPNYDPNAGAVNYSCDSAASDKVLQARIATEQATLNRDLAPIKVYPQLSFGFRVKL